MSRYKNDDNSREVFIFGKIDDTTAENVVKLIRQFNNEDDENAKTIKDYKEINMSLQILVKYHDPKYGQVKRLEKIEKGAWIDVYAAADTEVPSLFKRLESIKAYENHLEKLEEYYSQVESVLTNTALNKDASSEILKSVRNNFESENQYYLDSIKELYKPTLIPLGFSCRLPIGYEAHLAPRSSSFKFFNFVQTSNPFISGIIISNKIKSKSCSFTSFNVISPLLA